MPVHNNEIADIFDRLADLLEIEDANPFRVRAYRNAARTIRSHARGMSDLLQQGEDLSELPGIGDDLAGKIKSIVDTGGLPLLKEVEARTPGSLSDIMKIEGLGARRVRTLHKTLGIRTVDDLKRAARSGRIRELEGFGKKTEQKIRDRIERFEGRAARTKRIVAEEIAVSLVAYLKACKGVKDIVIAGSYRRCKETVGDLDILITARKDSPVMDRFVEYDEVIEIISKGKTRSAVRLRSGLSVDLRVVPQVSYGAALVYFTGSKAHNIAIRKLGIKKGLKINEYGVFKGDRRIAGKTEAAVYKSIGLPFIPPEIRQDRGELEAARKGRLPGLLTLNDIRGDLHCHSKATDGHHTIAQMAEAARKRGYEYISINDHSKHVTVARGLDEKRLLEQIRTIDRLNDRLDGFKVLKSIEVDILENGKLDMPDDVLGQLDFTVCAIHYKLDLSAGKQTDRVLRAMDNPFFNIFAHPTGRLINEREPYPIDIERIMRAARSRGCILELNAHPDRLDLAAESCRMAKDIGVKVAISTDAHRTTDLDYMRFGIEQARRGWLDRADVVNTYSLGSLSKMLARN